MSNTFDGAKWRHALTIGERWLSVGSNSFDVERYQLLLEAECAFHPELASPRSLVQLPKKHVLRLLERCEVQPVGHRVALYAALHALRDNPSMDTIPSPSPPDPPGTLHTSASTMSTTAHPGRCTDAMTPEKYAQWIRTTSKATLFSRVDDVHVQLLRPNTIGKRVRVGGKLAEKPSHATGGVFELDTELSMPSPPSPPGGSGGAFTWVDVVGTWSSSLPSASIVEPPLAFSSRLQRLREFYSAPKAASDECLQRVLLASSPQRHYQTDSPRMPQFSSVQMTLESVLKSIEVEYGVELPLSTIARRVQDPDSYTQSRDVRTSTVQISSTSTLSKKRIGERIRQRIEESMTLSYFNASIFAEDELRDLRAECHALKCRGGQIEDERSLAEAKERQLQDEQRILDELRQQHMFVLRTATSPFGTLAQSSTAFLAPTGSEQHSDLLKTNHNQLALIFSKFLEQQGKNNVSSDRAYIEPWVLYVDLRQNLVVTVRPRDTIVMGRMHTNFDACFAHLSFTDFVGMIIEASVLHSQMQVDSMYSTLDEVQRFLAPSSVRRVLEGDSSTGATGSERMEQLRRRRYNVRSYDPSAPKVVNVLNAIRGLAVRVARSAWRKLRRRKTRPRDMTLAALRLLNFVNRQASVFGRTLGDAKHLTEFARISLCGGCVPQGVRGAHTSFPKAAHHTTIRSTLHPGGHDHTVGGVWNRSHATHGPTAQSQTKGISTMQCLDMCAYEDCLWAQESQRLADETAERCRQLRHLTGELMSLAMALDAETYDENLAVIGFVTALFAPMNYWAANMGTNFRCPLFSDRHAYLASWVVFLNFMWLLVWWFYYRYHNIDIAQSATTYIRRVGKWARRHMQP